MASDGFQPATPSVHTTPSGEVRPGTSHESSAAAQKRLQRLRGRPARVKNKPKTKVEAAPRPRRQVKRRAQQSQFLSSASDMKTPIVIRVQPNVRANKPPPPNKTRRTKATKVNITTAEEGREHVGRKRQRSLIIRNFSTDLQSFLNHLNNQGGVSGLSQLLNIHS